MALGDVKAESVVLILTVFTTREDAIKSLAANLPNSACVRPMPQQSLINKSFAIDGCHTPLLHVVESVQFCVLNAFNLRITTNKINLHSLTARLPTYSAAQLIMMPYTYTFNDKFNIDAVFSCGFN